MVMPCKGLLRCNGDPTGGFSQLMISQSMKAAVVMNDDRHGLQLQLYVA